MVSLEILSLIAFVIVIGGLLLRDRKNINFHYGLIIRKWSKGLDAIDRMIKQHPKLIRRLGNVGIVIGILASIIGLVSIVFLTLKSQQSFALILPTAGGYKIPGPVVSIPFWYWLIAIFIMGSTHEMLHAVFMRFERVPVKNFGILMFLLYPLGVFVEPNQKKIEKLSISKKLRILSAGSFANFITAVLAIGIFLLGVVAFDNLVHVNGVNIESVEKNSPAGNVSLAGKIITIDGQSIKNTSDFVKAFNETEVGDNVSITTDKGSYQLTITKNPKNESNIYVGMTVRTLYEYNIFGFIGMIPLIVLKVFFAVMSFLNWLFVLSLGIGVANLLPWKPFDGGLIYEEIFKKFFKDKGAVIIKITTATMFAIVLLNFVMPILKSII